MSFEQGQLVRVKGMSGTYRVHKVEGDEVSCFGGPHRQWRTFLAGNLRKATKAEERTFLRNEKDLLQAARGIKPAPPIKGKR